MLSEAHYRETDGVVAEQLARLMATRGHVRTLAVDRWRRSSKSDAALLGGTIVCLAAETSRKLVVFCGKRNLHWYSMALAEWANGPHRAIEFDDNGRYATCVGGCRIWFVHLDELRHNRPDEATLAVVRAANTVLMELWMAASNGARVLFAESSAQFLLYGDSAAMDERVPCATVERDKSYWTMVGDSLPVLKSH